MGPSERPVVTLLTDFGLDGAVAACKGVILGICPDAQIVDVAHGIRKFAIGDGAFVLRSAVPFMPISIHVAVVDPGVGTDRRAIAIRAARGDVLIGPDNGLLVPAADALGGVGAARELTNRALWLPRTSDTFHGRDIFAPVAAHLAAGDATFESVGPEVSATELVRLPDAKARATTNQLETAVTYVDSFGNLRLAGGARELEAAFGRISLGARINVVIGEMSGEASFVRTFGDARVGATVLYVDSTGDLALADHRASLAARTGAAAGASVTLQRS
jgi:S-adenosyl-L-methionine hydrolase (adenosine-forming)